MITLSFIKDMPILHVKSANRHISVRDTARSLPLPSTIEAALRFLEALCLLLFLDSPPTILSSRNCGGATPTATFRLSGTTLPLLDLAESYLGTIPRSPKEQGYVNY